MTARKFCWADPYNDMSRAAVRRMAEAMAEDLNWSGVGENWRPMVKETPSYEGWYQPFARHVGRGVTVYAINGTSETDPTRYFASVDGTWDGIRGEGRSPHLALRSLNRLLDRLRDRYERARHGPE